MWEVYIFLLILVTIFSILPLIPNTHWIFRVADFGKIQLDVFAILIFVLGFFAVKSNYWWYTQSLLLIIILFHSSTLIKYTPLYPIKKKQATKRKSSQVIKILSANIYQFNTDFERFIKVVKKYQPDIFLTMESDKKWENAMRTLETEYPFHHKVTLENTYGMHLYSKLKIENAKTHYFVADDIPSVEAHIKLENNFDFVFFGVHPPPPSPTEEETSKERDGDLLSIAKRIKNIKKPVIVVGDFNNVAWSKSSILFRKTSELIDPRIGHGFLSTYHAKYKLLRFPIDLMFHSANIYMKTLKTLENFGSDHLPIFCEFYINNQDQSQKDEVEKAESEEIHEAEEMITEGKKEHGNRDEVAKEN